MEIEDEGVTLERLTYLIIEKVGPSVLISYNVLRDKLKEEFDLHHKLLEETKDNLNP